MATVHDRDLFDDTALLDFEEPGISGPSATTGPRKRSRNVVSIVVTGAMLLAGLAAHSPTAGVASASLAAVVAGLLRR